MALNFGTLTLDTKAGPSENISIDARLYKPRCNKLLSCSDAKMRNSVQRMKHSASPFPGHQRALKSGRRVAVEWTRGVGQGIASTTSEEDGNDWSA